MRSSRSLLASFSVIIAFALIGSSLVAPSMAFAAATVSPAGGGTNISIDKTSANGGTSTPTPLNGPTITENNPGEIGTGIHTISLPSGWKFDTSPITIGVGGNTVLSSTSVTPNLPDLTSFSFTVVTPSTGLPSPLMFFGLKVIPTGTTVSSGNMTMTAGTIAGVDGSTNFGTLSTIASTVAKVAFSTQPGNAEYGSLLSPQPVVKTQDHFGNPSVVGLGASKMVTLSLSSGTGALLGTVALDIGTGAGNGTAIFTNVTVDTFGTSTKKQLTASADVLTPAVSTDFEITQKVLSATITASDKPYDGNNSATFTNPTPIGAVFSDVLTLSPTSGSATFTDANAGIGKTVTAIGLTLNGEKAGNYSYDGTASTAAEHGATISKLGIVISPAAGQKVYGNAEPGNPFTHSPALIGSDTFTGTLGRALGENVGTYAYTLGTVANGLDNYSLSIVASPATFEITKRPITVRASDNTKPYDSTPSAAAIPTITVGSLADGDNMSNFIETYANPDVTLTGVKELTASGTAGGNSGNNYSYTFPHTMNGIITKKSLTVSGLSATSKPYDGNLVAEITGTPELVGVVNNEDISLTVGTLSGLFDNANAGSRTVTVSGLSLNATDAVKANYSLTQPTLNATISPLEVTITPNASQTKVYGQDDPVFGYTHTALIGNDDVTGALGRVDGKNVGTYIYTLGGLGGLSAGPNYHLNLGDGPSGPSLGAINLGTAGNFAILSKTGITDVPPSVITGNIGTSLDQASTDTAFAGITCLQVTGLIYSFNSTGPLPCVHVDSSLIGTAVGDMMTAYTNASAPATPAGTDATNLNVGGGTLNGQNFVPGTYTWNNPGSVTITGDITLTGSATDVWIFQVNGTLNIASGKKITLAGGALPKNIFWQVTGAVTLVTDSTFEGNILAQTNIAMQSGATLHGRALAQSAVTLIANTVTIPESGSSASTFAITPKLLTVTATGENKVYNANPTATVTLSSSDIVSGDAVTLANTTATFADKNVNVGDAKLITVSGISKSGDDAGNYTLANTTATATANITPKTLTATITVDPKVYDGFNSATILTRALNEGVISGDTVTLNADGTATFDNKNVDENKAISAVGITLGGADAGNYSLTQPSLNNGVITPKTLTVSATGIDKEYNADATATVNLHDDRVAGNDLTLGYTATFSAGKNVGNNKTVSVTGISITDGTDAGNYTLGNTTAATTANIIPKTLTATITVKDKVYDGNNTATITDYSPIGKIDGDTITLSGGTAIFTSVIEGNNKDVTATGITLGGADAGNYSYNGAATGTGNILSMPTVVYVNKTYTDGYSDTYTFGYNAFNTIQEGINAVNVNGTVNVAAGTYTEPIQQLAACGNEPSSICINKSLTLRGNPGDTATGPGLNAPVLDGTGLSNGSAIALRRGGYENSSNLVVSNVTIEGFIIKNYTNPGNTGGTGSGIIAWNTNASSITVQDNSFENLGWDGVLVGSDTNAIQSGWTVSNNTFVNIPEIAIELTNVTNSQVSNNTITGPSSITGDTPDAGVGIEIAVRNRGAGLTAGSNVSVTGNQINGAFSFGSRAGINILARTYDTATAPGILDSVTIDGNTINGTATRGINVASEQRKSNVAYSVVSNLTIKNNTISTNDIGIRFGFVSGNPGADGTYTNNIISDKNSISGNTTANVDNKVNGLTVNAKVNYWGSSNGPSNGAIIGTVDYRPWCTNQGCDPIDVDAPTVLPSYVPSDNAVGVDPTNNISIPFSEAVNIASGDITLTTGGNPVAFAIEGNGTATIVVNPDATLSNNSTYIVTVKNTTSDLAGNTLASEKSWSFTTAGSYSLTLTNGWNLVSVGVVPNNNSIATILGASSSSVESIWSYDAVTGNWTSNHPNGPTENTLLSMTAGNGYWVNYTNASPVTLSGAGNLFLAGENTPPSTTLKAGWNLIGYYQKQSYASAPVLKALKNNLESQDATPVPWWSTIVKYDNSAKQFGDVFNNGVLSAGQGYWILMGGRATDTYIYAPGETPEV